MLTSISEGIPVTIIEAMAAGLPVVATDVGGVGEVVVDESTGLLAPSGDDEALARGIVELIENSQRMSQMGQQGRRRAREVFSQREMHSAYGQMYRQMQGA